MFPSHYIVHCFVSFGVEHECLMSLLQMLVDLGLQTYQQEFEQLYLAKAAEFYQAWIMPNVLVLLPLCLLSHN